MKRTKAPTTLPTTRPWKRGPTDDLGTRLRAVLLAWLLFAPSVFVFGPPDAVASGPRSFALLIGINQYRFSDPTIGFYNLSQTLHDVERMRQILPTFGFSAASLRVLTDEKATKKAILAELAKIKAEVKPGDRVLLYFSGHGFKLADLDPSLGLSKTESSLVVHDTQIDKPKTHLRGSWLETWRDSLKTHRVILLFDACHSGGLLTKSVSRKEEPCQGRGRPRFVPNPSLLRSLPASASSRARYLRQKLPPPPLYQSGLPVTMTAAHYHQVACESGPDKGGVFTLLLVEALQRLHSRPKASFGDVMTRIQEGLKGPRFRGFAKDQTPKMLGPADAPVLFRGMESHRPPPSAAPAPLRACHDGGSFCATFWLALHSDPKNRPQTSVPENTFTRLFFSTTKPAQIRLWFQSTEGNISRVLPEKDKITRALLPFSSRPGRTYIRPKDPRQGFQAKGPPGPVRFFLEAWPLPSKRGDFQLGLVSEAASPPKRRPVRLQLTVEVVPPARTETP